MKKRKGKCIVCGKETSNKNFVVDEPNSPPYLDWLCDECAEDAYVL